MYALTAGLPSALARPMVSLTFTIVAVSIIVHGVSVTPLLGYLKRTDRKNRR
jgi:NhaP-type Na+/H+ or K+/H+ antiporter